MQQPLGSQELVVIRDRSVAHCMTPGIVPNPLERLLGAVSPLMHASA